MFLLQELMNEQRPLPETDASVKPSQENNVNYVI